MRLTARELGRATLARQLLLRREALPVTEAVRRLVALQAQEPASPYLALWNRLEDFAPAELDAALHGADLVKATLIRITLHLVHAEDHAGIHTAMQPSLRGARLADPRFTISGLTARDADAVLPELLEFLATPRSAEQAQQWLTERLGVPGKPVWWAMRQVAPLRHVPTGGPWQFGPRPAYTTAGPPPPGGPEAWDAPLPALVRRYLAAFGPATPADVAQFLFTQRARVRAAVQALDGELEHLEGPDGEDLLDVPGSPRPGGDVPAPPRLLGMWDQVLLAHADRTRVLPAEYRRTVARTNGDVLPTLLVDGLVAGVWRPVDGGVEAHAFSPLARADWVGLAAEAAPLSALLAERDPRTYRRYDRWWATLPDGERRVLPG